MKTTDPGLDFRLDFSATQSIPHLSVAGLVLLLLSYPDHVSKLTGYSFSIYHGNDSPIKPFGTLEWWFFGNFISFRVAN